MQEYHRRFKKLGLPTSQTLSGRAKRELVHLNVGQEAVYSTGDILALSLSSGMSMSPSEPQIEDLLAILKNEVSTRKNKNVEVLHLASNVVRRLSGENCALPKSPKVVRGVRHSDR